MKRRLLLGILTMMLAAGPLFAQNRAVTGKVSAAEDDSPLPGVTVQLKGSSTGTQTDFEGKFSLSVPASGGTLVLRFVGFKTQEIAIGNQSSFDIKMATDDKVLSEVVVTGYGTQEKREITGSISSVKGDVIQNLPMQSFDRALQGRAAGVLVQSANGAPGGAVQVRIRGVGSISAGNEPLYVVDGVQMNNSSNTNNVSNNPLAFLNPNDIESIEVLKDAAAASIYGAQAANGVVLVTTKKGKVGRTTFNIGYYTGLVEPIRQLNVTNSQQWIQARLEAVQNQNPTASAQAVRANVLGGIRLPADFTDAQIAALPTYDWQDVSYRNGVNHNIELSANGGNEKTTFAVSGSYNKQDANVIGVNFRRATGRVALKHNVNKKLSFETNLNLSNITQSGPFGSPVGGSFLGSPSFSSPLILPMNPIYNEDGSFFGLPQNGGLAGILNQNVLANAEFNTIKNRINQLVGNAAAIWQIAKGLTFRSDYALDYRYINGEYYQDPRTADGFANRGSLFTENEQIVNFQTKQFLDFSRTFAKNHKISALLGVEYRKEERESWDSQVNTFPTSAFRTGNTGATPISVGSFWTGWTQASVFTRLSYDYKQRYIVSMTVRRDGNSRFGANNRYGTFPSISAAWLLSEENFLKNKVEWLDEIKIRASYGQTGNSQIGGLIPDNFASRGLFGGGFNYGADAGIAPTSLANPNLRWERVTTSEVGVDFALFNRRLSGTVGYFDRRSSDLLLSQPVSWVSGVGAINNNVGKMFNRGLEFELNTVNVVAGDFNWKTNFNFTVLENKVTQLVGSDTVLASDQSVRTGHPIGAIFTSQYAGVNPATGRPMWYDVNNNLTYIPLNPRDFRVLGAGLATRYGGVTNDFTYKGLTLSVFFQYEFGRKAFNGQNSFLTENGGRLFNILTDVYERRWTTPGQLTDVPRPINGNAEVRGASALAGSRTLEDASYIRLKTVTLSYNLPTSLVNRAKLSRVRVYAQGLNLITWTKWTGYDPEFVNLGSGNNGVIPLSRNYTFGIDIGF
jgi:TonB-dependent starch-binding outer membrane protein SusC